MDYKSVQPDVKNNTGPHHFFLGGFTALVLLIVYISINTPSASTSGLSEFNNQPEQSKPPSEGTQPVEAAGIDTWDNTAVAGLIVVNPVAVGIELPDSRQQTALGAPEKSVDAAIVLASYSPPEEIDLDSGPDIETPSLPEAAINIPAFTDPEPFDSEPVVETPPDPIAIFLDSQDWVTAKVRNGDTLSQIFNRNDLKSREAYSIAKMEEAAELLKIRPGEKIRIKKGPDGQLGLLNYQLSLFEILSVRMTGVAGEYTVSVDVREPEIRINNARATINYSLLGAAQEAGLSYKTMYQFIAMFGWQVDFSMDLQPGDRFSIIFEELFLDHRKIGDGEIIAAELIISGKKLQAVRHIDEAGYTDYFAPGGGGIKGTFLRSPLKFGHITSNFSKSRLHPIKKVWRAHNGADYGAPRGTPVMATGTGTVTSVGKRNGYGRTILIRHGGKYETLYAHLNGYAKGVKFGSRVNQGDIIGYVGSSGLATGPHLHYEFRIHGIHKNPATVTFPKSDPIAKKYLSAFSRVAAIWVSELDNLERIPLAQNQVQ